MPHRNQWIRSEHSAGPRRNSMRSKKRAGVLRFAVVVVRESPQHARPSSTSAPTAHRAVYSMQAFQHKQPGGHKHNKESLCKVVLEVSQRFLVETQLFYTSGPPVICSTLHRMEESSIQKGDFIGNATHESEAKINPTYHPGSSSSSRDETQSLTSETDSTKTESEGETASSTDIKVTNPSMNRSDSSNRAESTAPRSDFSYTGDSPYFERHIDKEMQNLAVLTETLKDISAKTKAFVKCGAQMSEAAMRLSQACKLDPTSDSSQTDPSILADRKSSVGDDVAAVLKVVSLILDEFAESQMQMCNTVHTALSASLEDFIGGDLLNAKKLKVEADEATASAESGMAKYLHGKQMSIPTTSAELEQSLATAMNTWNVMSENVGSQMKSYFKATNNSDSESGNDTSSSKDSDRSRRFRRGKAPTGDKKDEQLERVISTATLIHNLQDIRLSCGTAELKRFHLLRHLDLLKCRRNFELSGSTIVSLNGIKSHFMYCQDFMLGLQSRIDDLLLQQMTSKNLFESHQAPWDEREKSLKGAISEVDKDATNAAVLLEALSKGMGVSPEEIAKLDPPPPHEVIEQDLKIWTVSNMFAEKSLSHKEPTPGIVFEGWLYKKASSRISLNPWSRRWFILDNKAIYYLNEATSNENPKRGGMSVTVWERVKVCDVVLCTVREVHDRDRSKGNNEGARFCFEIFSANSKPYMLQAVGPNDVKLWIDSIRRCVEKQLISGSAPAQKMRIDSNEFTANDEDDDQTDHSPAAKNPIVKQILLANPICADCGTTSPDWASLNLGALICIECSGVHRSLGVQYSKVRSLTLDELTSVQYQMISSMGNKFVNSIWEKGSQRGWSKPQADDPRKVKEEWIKSKYMWRGFVERNEEEGYDEKQRIEACSSSLYDAAKQADLYRVAESLAQGASVNWVNEMEGGKTPLHVVAISRKKADGCPWHGLEIAEFLIQNGANLKVLDRDQQSALDIAVVGGGEIEMVEYLVAKTQ